MAFKWNDHFNTGIEEIDKQHKKLFEIGTKIYHALSAKDDYDHYDEIMSILVELKDYTHYHFTYEEALMEKYGFKNLEQHKITHSLFEGKIRRISKKDIENMQEETYMELMNFVSDWISNHILDTDMAYVDCFNRGFTNNTHV